MKQLTIILLCFLCFGCVQMHDPRIVGTFLSDKETTMDYLKESGKFNEYQLDYYSRMLGRVKIECNGEIMISSLDDHSIIEPVNIIRKTDEYIILIKKFLCEVMHQKILFTDDGYWMIGDFAKPDYREKFIRIGKYTAIQ